MEKYKKNVCEFLDIIENIVKKKADFIKEIHIVYIAKTNDATLLVELDNGQILELKRDPR